MARRTGLEGAKKWGKPDRHRRFPCANCFFCTFRYAPCKHLAINEGTDRVHTRTTKGVILSDPADHVFPEHIFKNTTHRDGSIYKGIMPWLKRYRLTDRDETRLEPGMYSEPAGRHPEWERWMVHSPSRMLQIYSLKLSQIPIDHKSVELYGYIAVRDYQDSLLNYIVNRSRDDPIIVQQGSLIPMTGPKRAISMRSAVLLEFDMRIKKGEQKENDLQLIDGASEFNEVTAPQSLLTTRIKGDCGAVDITRALVYEAVEATIEVVIPEVLTGFSLSISSFVSIYGLSKEIQLFHGTICESCALRRSVIAVTVKTWMHLKFKIGKKGSKNGLKRCCSFEATNIGCASQQIMLDIASISAKVTWSSVPL